MWDVHYVIKFVSDLQHVYICQWFSVGLGFLHQLNWPPQYNWNIVESGDKYQSPIPPPTSLPQRKYQEHLYVHTYIPIYLKIVVFIHYN